MSEKVTACSFGDPNAQPPTPQQTPDCLSFASPVLETPRQPQDSFTETGDQTPRFAEDYSVFNSTPGNLRGSHGTFGTFVPPNGSGHKRFLSTDSLNLDIAPQKSPITTQRTLYSPGLATPTKETSETSAKKARRGTVGKDSDSTHILSPPPTARKGEHKLNLDANMQNDHVFGQPDFGDMSQSQEMAALITSHNDMFSYPLSAPAGGSNFWDTSAAMSMDMDFAASSQSMFSTATSGHRPSGSFDWNNDIQLFQEANQLPPSSNQENTQPDLQLNMNAVSVMQHQVSAPMNNCAVPANYQTMHQSFNTMLPGEAVNPDLLLSRPSSASFNADFVADATERLEAPQSVPPKRAARDGRRTSTGRAGKMPDRAFASSPLKGSRPGLTRSFSETRGRKALARGGALPSLAPASKQAQGTRGAEGRNSGRISPLKSQRRLSGLASIPEAPLRQMQQQRRASVRFTIDSHGRARAETTLPAEGGGMSRSQSSRDLSFKSQWHSSEDDSSDEEPITIPSRNNSFSASFALPDPRKPVGSIFHGSKLSTSDKSSSASGANDDESEAETVMNEGQGKGDAASELRKVVRGRQKRASLAGVSQPHRLLTNLGHFQDGTISPSSLTESGYGTDGQGVRCVCNRSGPGEGDGFMVQCESCEMWLHGKCINITKRDMPSVYICRFCANTASTSANRLRDGRNNALGLAPAISPLGTRTFQSFR
ncbi:hypothetical protein VHEMI02075 [[Torrubiella] hemipterigena]|uniref:PHD-type domain-containing protein n=1 Tax=[Torrubiella] hemipterigena TaxID=1531966 RepID=A0A0A1T735_9HYPO|nr:hypothetical protein VHEMI02075 [[Torrubiella] hemipterigena]